MKKRIQIDVFLEDKDFDNSITEILAQIKAKAKNISNEEKSRIRYHDCGHDEGKPCKNIVEVL